MCGELVRNREEVIMGTFMVLFQHLHGKTEENYRKH
jgi:hypothetical protein